jgi:crotonobetainyl-CoA:carnitine CoA-transferase CaiB-like acyl-CoA transferase
LDLTRVLAGPVATRFLAGLGAEVLRLDPPGWDEPGVLPDVTLGKRRTRLDLRTRAGRDRFEALLRGADLLVHGYRPGALDGLGWDAAHRQALRPGLVEVSLNAYGWDGPWRDRRGFDSLVQMSCGIAEAGMARLGKEKPFPLPVQALDHACGYIMAAAALISLRRRRETGMGSITRLSLARVARLLLAGRPGGRLCARRRGRFQRGGRENRLGSPPPPRVAAHHRRRPAPLGPPRRTPWGRRARVARLMSSIPTIKETSR